MQNIGGVLDKKLRRVQGAGDQLVFHQTLIKQNVYKYIHDISC